METTLTLTTAKTLICWCCGKVHLKRDPATDPWEGRMDGYCGDCSWARCDAYANECPNALHRI